jgi:2-keto-4-pentenoate hydratase/2-oxohepta-3-ene-1,7-dioic acid hydratase in catechol pathway
MLICAYPIGDSRSYGIIEGTDVYHCTGDLFSGKPMKGDRVGSLADIHLIAPVQPSKILCIGRNYVAHAQERGAEVPSEPLLFLKPPSALADPGEPICLLADMGRVDHEAELAVVIGKRGRFIREADAYDYVLGYTCANDISARDYQSRDGQWSRAKGFDTFCPVGPWINTDLDISHLQVTCTVNEERRQSGNTDEMVFKVPFLIAHLSKIMTLEPGDLILTGTPSGIGPLIAGDHVIVEIEGIGTLSNPVELITPLA